MDFCLCLPSLLFKFIDFLQEECKLGHGGRLGYVDAISELIDFRKVNGASDAVLRKLSVTELQKSVQDSGKDDEIARSVDARVTGQQWKSC